MDKIYFGPAMMVMLNINLELESLTIEQRRKALEILIDYWSEKDQWNNSTNE